MISEIRNPWIRRALVLALGPLVVVVITICDVLSPVEMYLRREAVADARDNWNMLRDAWRGPARK